jgi:hypothetical protein
MRWVRVRHHLLLKFGVFLQEVLKSLDFVTDALEEKITSRSKVINRKQSYLDLVELVSADDYLHARIALFQRLNPFTYFWLTPAKAKKESAKHSTSRGGKV